MTRNDEIVIVYYKEKEVEVLRIIECLSFAFITVLVSFYIRLLLRKKFCHRNLLVLLCAQPLSHLLSLSTRVIKHSLFFLDILDQRSLIFLNFVSDIMVSTSFQILVGIAVERIMAMYYINEYENMFKFPSFAVGVIVFTFSWSTLLMYLWYIYVVSNLEAYSMQYTFFGSAGIFFLILRIVCWRVYKRVANERESNIEDRYLTAQNLKTATLLIYLGPYKCATNVASLFAYHWIWEEHEPFYFPYYGNLYYLAGHVQIFVQLLLTVSGHECLISEVRNLFGISKTEERVREENIRSIIGGRMMFTNEEENDIYFKQLQDMWNAGCQNKVGPDRTKKYRS